jgi:hypothetical protein
VAKRLRRWRRAAASGVLALVAAAAAVTSGASAGAAFRPPPIKHVWVIVLENESSDYTFGATGQRQAPYLTKTLPAIGAYLPDYYGIGHDSLDNYVALVSGQSGNYELNEDCGLYSSFDQFSGENYDKWTKYGQLSGEGCVFPGSVKTLAGQLDASGDSWREYAQDMGIDPDRDGTVKTALGPACGHPPLNGTDLTDSTSPKNDSYATRHNPFMYFASITSEKRLCDTHVLSLTPLASDLKRASTTPSYSFITPNTCFDGHDWPKCQDGTPGRLPRINQFLTLWIPRIMASPAYKSGLIVITFDESGEDNDAGACCGEVAGLGYDDPSHPNMNEVGLYGPGGGRVGAVLLSPFIKPGTVSTRSYNHFSQLRSVEDIFGLAHLGDAGQPQVQSFGSDVYTQPSG